MAMKTDVAVIGGGPGGYVAAIRCAQHGLNTVLLEKDTLGGVCLNWGCIPTKALLKSAEVFDQTKNAAAYGVIAAAPKADLGAMVARSRKVAARLAGGVGFLMKKNKIKVINAAARLDKKDGHLKVVYEGGDKKQGQIEAAHIILATGARARLLPSIGLDPAQHADVWTAREAMTPQKPCASLLVIGSGAIGIEFASFYAALGTKVTVVEMAPRILPSEDEEISTLALAAFRKRGITFHVSQRLMNVSTGKQGIEAVIADEKGKKTTLKAEKIIAAVGISANVEGLGLEEAGIDLHKGHIATDALTRTSAKRVYAIGDVGPPPWLAHKASHEGVLCADVIAGASDIHPLDPLQIPSCTYGAPQTASLGMSEACARKKGIDIRVGRFPFSANGKALAMNQGEGLVKTIFDAQSGALIGAHMIGCEVTEMIQGYGVAMATESTEAELFDTVFAHPTLSEMMHESALAAYERALHI